MRPPSSAAGGARPPRSRSRTPHAWRRHRAFLATLLASLVTALCLAGSGVPSAIAAPATNAALAWGSNGYGQLGNGTDTDSTTPVDVALPSGTRATAIAGGGYFSLALAGEAAHRERPGSRAAAPGGTVAPGAETGPRGGARGGLA